MRPVDEVTLARWRGVDCVAVLDAVATYAKRDATFVPRKSAKSTRWHVRFDEREFELVLTGNRFWDVRSQAGGGGAVDLVMHLTGDCFKGAVKRLVERGL